MLPQRPDLSKVDPGVLQYIESLEAEIESLRRREPRPRRSQVAEVEEEAPLPELKPAEPPTSVNLITATASGIAKRTSRHLYLPQRRGGMGIFDLEAPEDQPPAILSQVDESRSLILITNQGRAFRMQASQIPETPVRGRGESILSRNKISMDPGEALSAILPVRAQGYVAVASRTGMVRLLRHHIFGEYMKPGASLYDPRSFGPLASACWTPGDGDLFIATRLGRAIRFSEKLIPPPGGLGLRVAAKDEVVAITPVYEDSRVFLLSADGRGTIRLMQGFSPNKAPGAGGKIAMSSDQLVSAVTVDKGSDIFIISRLSKIIRFQAAEVPAKEGVVQGVNCMTFRGDHAVALSVTLTEPAL